MEKLSEKNIAKLNSKKGLISLLSSDTINPQKSVRYIEYVKKLKELQVELIKLQTHIINNNQRMIVIFEGRDAAGKGGAIRRLTERINPRFFRIVALPKPSEEEQSQWYFQRYIKVFPKAGEILFFDRSWYNRAVVEPVNGFCTKKEYNIFMNQVNDFERMITESGIRLIKFYFSISKGEQAQRFEDIKTSPIKKWKYSAVDKKALELWDDYTAYKKKMFDKTNTKKAPWIVIRANRKSRARIEAIQKILEIIPYDSKDLTVIEPINF